MPLQAALPFADALTHNAALYWGAAIVVTAAVATWCAYRRQLDAWTMYLAGIGGLVGAWFGGEAFAWLAGSSLPGWPDSGAKGMFGALAGASGGAWVVLRWRSARFIAYADSAAPGVALGYAVYRIGCFLNGCCFGTVSELPWAVTFGRGTEVFGSQVVAGILAPEATHSLLVHPTELYHALLGVVGFILLMRAREDAPGTRLAQALFLYGSGRFVIQFFRGDAVPVWGPLDINHIGALVMLTAGLLVWRLRPALAICREQPA